MKLIVIIYFLIIINGYSRSVQNDNAIISGHFPDYPNSKFLVTNNTPEYNFLPIIIDSFFTNSYGYFRKSIEYLPVNSISIRTYKSNEVLTVLYLFNSDSVYISIKNTTFLPEITTGGEGRSVELMKILNDYSESQKSYGNYNLNIMDQIKSNNLDSARILTENSIERVNNFVINKLKKIDIPQAIIDEFINRNMASISYSIMSSFVQCYSQDFTKDQFNDFFNTVNSLNFDSMTFKRLIYHSYFIKNYCAAQLLSFNSNEEVISFEDRISKLIEISRKSFNNDAQIYAEYLSLTMMFEYIETEEDIIIIQKYIEDFKDNCKNIDLIKKLENDFKEDSKLLPGRKAIDFSLRDTSGNIFTLSKIEDKVILLHFWGTWCKTCINEIEHLKELSENIKNNILLVNIAYESSNRFNTWKEFIIDVKLPGINLFHDNVNDKVTEKYQVKKFPTYIIINKNGNIHSNKLHSIKDDSIMKRIIDITE